MPIISIIIGIVLMAISDLLQPDSTRKPKLNFYVGSIGGILWLGGVIGCFFSYKMMHAVMLLLGSFILAAILGVRKH